MPKAARTKKNPLPQKRREMPATIGLVEEVRDELKADIRGLEARMDSRFGGIESTLEEIRASVHRTQAIVESQHSENRIMLEHMVGLGQRFDKLEERQNESEATLRSLARSTQRP